MFLNKEIKNAKFPKLKKAYKNFLNNNVEMKKFNLPQLLSCGENFLEANEILDEYEEIIGQKTNSIIASNVIQTLLNAPSVELIDTFFRFDLIKDDPDVNKFVDCAIAGNATFIVSNDSHFSVLREIDFPKLILKSLQEFSVMLQ